MRSNSFDLLRLTGALLVLAGHSFPLLKLPAPVVAGFPIHSLGVHMFFAISGYLIANSVMRDADILRFTLRRSLRILPALWCLVAVTILCGALVTSLPTRDYFAHPQTAAYLSNLYLMTTFFLPEVFTQNPIPSVVNGSLWSLPAEVAMYVFAIASLRFGWRGLAVATLAFGVFIFMPAAYRDVTIGPIYLGFMPSVGTFFIAAMWIAVLGEKLPLNWTQAVITFAIAVGSQGPLVPTEVTYVLLAYAIIGAGVSPLPFSSTDRHMPDVSYGVFLYSYPLQQLLIQAGINDPYFLTFAATPIVLIIGVLSWYWIEKPALNFKPRNKVRQQTAIEAGPG